MTRFRALKSAIVPLVLASKGSHAPWGPPQILSLWIATSINLAIDAKGPASFPLRLAETVGVCHPEATIPACPVWLAFADATLSGIVHVHTSSTAIAMLCAGTLCARWVTNVARCARAAVSACPSPIALADTVCSGTVICHLDCMAVAMGRAIALLAVWVTDVTTGTRTAVHATKL